MTTWRVYGSAPLPVNCRSRFRARLLMWLYGRLGMSATIYESDEARGWVKRNRTDSPMTASHAGQPIDPRENRP